MTEPQTEWYVVKSADGPCQIVAATAEVAENAEQPCWGPFASQSEAIARRVGLIRAGKCKPV